MEEKKDDDEISIDLSKIKNIFKRKEKTEVHRTTEDTEEKHHAAEEHQKEHHETTHEKEDEISIDFGKIKNIFKSEPHEEKEHKVKHETHEEKKDDVIAIDFSKIKNIKNIFKKSEKTDDDEVSLDLNKMWSFIVKHKVLLLLIIPIFLSIFLRIQPAYLPITDQWAEDSVMNSLKSQIRGQIDQQYPNLPGQNKDALVESELQKLLQEQKAQIDLQLEKRVKLK